MENVETLESRIESLTKNVDPAEVRHFREVLLLICSYFDVITRAHSFPRKNLTNYAANLVNSVAHRGKADEIPQLTADTQLNFRGLIKS